MKKLIVLFLIVLFLVSCSSSNNSKNSGNSNNVNSPLSDVILMYPKNGTTVTNMPVVLRWRQVSSVKAGVSYTIYLGKDPSQMDIIAVGYRANVFVLDNLEEGLYFWQVEAVDTEGNITESPIFRFFVTEKKENINLPSYVRILAPSPGSTFTTNRVELCWEDIASAYDFTVYMGEDPASVSPVTTTANTCYEVSNLHYGKRYYWLVEADLGAKKIRSYESYFDIKPPPLTQPELISPAMGEEVTDVTFKWSRVYSKAGNVYYSLYIGRSTRGLKKVASGLTDTKYSFIPLKGSTYYWYVEAEDEFGDSVSSAISYFSVSGPSEIDSLSLGGSAPEKSSGCVVISSGELYCWGNNDSGMLGFVNSYAGSPVKISNKYSGTYKKVFVGISNSCALMDNGMVCWGSRNNRKLGDTLPDNNLEPYFVSKDFVKAAIGDSHICFLSADGKVWCSGDNSYGQRGTDTVRNWLSKVNLPALDWVDVVSGKNFSCALSRVGTLYCWGDNSRGEIARKEKKPIFTPVEVTSPDGSGWIMISAGWEHLCGISGEGNLYCWGDNSEGEVSGNGVSYPDTISYPVKISLPAGEIGWKWVTAGAYDSCAEANSGAIYCWGFNGNDDNGRYALGVSEETPVPITEISVYNPDKFALGSGIGCYVSSNNLYCWGDSFMGGVGYGYVEATDLLEPLKASYLSLKWKFVGGSSDNICGITTDGDLWCWGQNDNNYIPINNGRSEASLPVKVDLPSGSWGKITSLEEDKSIRCGLSSEGKIFCWGYDPSGVLGHNDEYVDYPVEIHNPNGNAWIDVSSGHDISCGVDDVGNLWCWGKNEAHLLIDDQQHSDLVKIPIPERIRSVAIGYLFACAVAESGTLYCWGNNGWYQLGVVGGTDYAPFHSDAFDGLVFKSISAGYDHMCGITIDGSLYCWGRNSYGQVGVDSADEKIAMPLKVEVGDYSWKIVKSFQYATCGITENNRVYCWGNLNNPAVSKAYYDFFTPTLIVQWNSNIISFFSSYTGLCFIDETQSLYCQGRNNGSLDLWRWATSPVKVITGD